MSLLALLPTSTPTGIHLFMLKFSHLFAQSTKCHLYRTWPIFPEHGITSSGVCDAQNLNARSFNSKLNLEIAKNARIQIKVRFHHWKTNWFNVGELFRNNVQVRIGCRGRWWINILRFAHVTSWRCKENFFFFFHFSLFFHCICAKGVLLLDWHSAVKCCFVF